MLYSPGFSFRFNIILVGVAEMKSVTPFILISAILLLGAACDNSGTITTSQSNTASAPVSTATPDEMASARANFAKHCVTCHGERGQGGRVTVDGKKLKVPSLREGHALTHPDDKLVRQINEGDEEMPAFKDKLKPEEINDLVRFIHKELQGKP
jgi:mono/diheme cytochrome c family protein